MKSVDHLAADMISQNKSIGVLSIDNERYIINQSKAYKLTQ